MGHENTIILKKINYKSQYKRTNSILSMLGLDIDLKKKIYELGMGEKQFVEIVRCLLGNLPKILIMDEPTSSLGIQEVKKIFSVIHNLKNNGVTIIYISHRIEELLEIGDYITIFRDGEHVNSAEVKDVDTKWIISKMMGRSNHNLYEYRSRNFEKKPILQVDNLCMTDEYGRDKLSHCSFYCQKGEILGIYGLLGAGRTELLHTIIGEQKGRSGSIVFHGENITNYSIPQIIRKGIAIVTEDRKGSGIVPTMSIQGNASLISIKKILHQKTLLKKIFLISRKIENEVLKDIFDKMLIKFSFYNDLITTLSGGNQQKVLLSRSLLPNPLLVLLDEPTRGIDIHAKSDIYTIINTLANLGMSVLYTTSELSEATEISDRLLIMANGKITGILDHSEYSHEKIVRLASPNKENIYAK